MTIEIIDQCIEKWKAIKNGELPLLKGVKQCPLCYKYLQNLCSECPLAKSGNGCLNSDSNWTKYYNAYYDFFYDDTTVKDLPRFSELTNEILDCIDTMIENLEEAKGFVK